MAVPAAGIARAGQGLGQNHAHVQLQHLLALTFRIMVMRLSWEKVCAQAARIICLNTYSGSCARGAGTAAPAVPQFLSPLSSLSWSPGMEPPSHHPLPSLGLSFTLSPPHPAGPARRVTAKGRLSGIVMLKI